jgi:hypothetical protein
LKNVQTELNYKPTAETAQKELNKSLKEKLSQNSERETQPKPSQHDTVPSEMLFINRAVCSGSDTASASNGSSG